MKYSLTLLKATLQTHDTKSFMLTKPHDFLFIPGQYALFTIDGYDSPPRPFTFSNSPDDAHLEITVKKVGDFTSRLFELEVGSELVMDGPKGQALNFEESMPEDIVFIAGGSGITPFMSIVRYAKARDLDTFFFMFYANKTEDDIIFRKEIEDLLGRDIVHILSEQKQADFRCEFGYLTKEMIQKHVDLSRRYLWYICGPPPMTKAIKSILSDLSISTDLVRIDPWEISTS